MGAHAEQRTRQQSNGASQKQSQWHYVFLICLGNSLLEERIQSLTLCRAISYRGPYYPIQDSRADARPNGNLDLTGPVRNVAAVQLRTKYGGQHCAVCSMQHT